MKRMITIIASLAVSAFVIKKVFGRKHITSREDDPSIPPVPTSAF